MNILTLFILALLMAINLCMAHSSMYNKNKIKSSCDGHCGDDYCFSAFYTSQHHRINYTLYVFEGGAPLGWYAVAQGTGMIGANMAINWVNADLSQTTSHRSTKAHVMPLTSEVTVKKFSLNRSVQKTQKGLTIWSWDMPMTKDPLTAVQHVFAHCPITPNSSSVDAIIRKHDRHDVGIALDLTKTCNGYIPSNLVGKVPSY